VSAASFFQSLPSWAIAVGGGVVFGVAYAAVSSLWSRRRNEGEAEGVAARLEKLGIAQVLRQSDFHPGKQSGTWQSGNLFYRPVVEGREVVRHELHFAQGGRDFVDVFGRIEPARSADDETHVVAERDSDQEHLAALSGRVGAALRALPGVGIELGRSDNGGNRVTLSMGGQKPASLALLIKLARSVRSDLARKDVKWPRPRQ
jgi:hypothetical protein